MKIPFLIALALLLVGSFASLGALCNGRGEVDLAPFPPFAGTSWTLYAIGDGDEVREVSTDPPVTLEFQPDTAELGGGTGCNGYFGRYEVKPSSAYLGDGDTFRTVDVSMTERGCPTMALFEREQEYSTALAYAERAVLTHDRARLVILAQGGRVLIFRP